MRVFSYVIPICTRTLICSFSFCSLFPSVSWCCLPSLTLYLWRIIYIFYSCFFSHFFTQVFLHVLFFSFSLYLNTSKQSLSLCSLLLAITRGNPEQALNCIFNLHEEREAKKKPAELRGFILRVSEEHYVALFRPEAQQDAQPRKLLCPGSSRVLKVSLFIAGSFLCRLRSIL